MALEEEFRTLPINILQWMTTLTTELITKQFSYPFNFIT